MSRREEELRLHAAKCEAAAQASLSIIRTMEHDIDILVQMMELRPGDREVWRLHATLSDVCRAKFFSGWPGGDTYAPDALLSHRWPPLVTDDVARVCPRHGDRLVPNPLNNYYVCPIFGCDERRPG